MRVVNSSFEILQFPTDISLLETCGRVCYRSEPKGEPEKFVKKIINNGHLSVIEHLTVSVRIICDRAIANELVRHRLCSFSQESTRYVNYDKKGMVFIKPCFWHEGSPQYEAWESYMLEAEENYCYLIAQGAQPQEARSVLPNSLKTEIIMSCNLRELRHILDLRCSAKAHPQIKEICLPLLKEVYARCPVVFEDIYLKYCLK
jgi:thymidylate synthase (FAD)